MNDPTFKYFDYTDFYCKCGKCSGRPYVRFEKSMTYVASVIDELRDKLGRPIVISSGWRCENHPAEAKKQKKGFHHYGIAVDIALKLDNPNSSYPEFTEAERYRLLKFLLRMGFNGIGIAEDFIHADARKRSSRTIWLYR